MDRRLVLAVHRGREARRRGLPVAGVGAFDLVLTPGAIKAEMDRTRDAIVSIGTDYHNVLVAPFLKAYDDAAARYPAEMGIDPPDRQTILEYMGATSDQGVESSFEPELIHGFRAFRATFDHFYDEHVDWVDRLSQKSYAQTIAFKSEAEGWRQRLAAWIAQNATYMREHFPTRNPADVVVTPPLTVPTPGIDTGIPWGKVTILVGVVAAALVVPPIVTAISARQAAPARRRAR